MRESEHQTTHETKRFPLFAFAFVGLSVGMSGWQAAAAPGPGCDTTWTAVAYYADRSPADPSGAPVPCAVKVADGDYGGNESRVAVAPNGDVLETPATS